MAVRICGTHCEYYLGTEIVDQMNFVSCAKSSDYLVSQAAIPCKFGLERKADEPDLNTIKERLFEDM